MRVGAARRDSPPAIRLRPVPPSDPPFDDEVTPHTWTAAFGAAQPPPHPLALDSRDATGWWPGARGPACNGVDHTGSGAGPPSWDGTDRPWDGTDHQRDGIAEAKVGSAGTAHASASHASASHASASHASASHAGAAQDGAGGAGAWVGPAGSGRPAYPAGAVAGASPEARTAVRRFLGLCLEILNGYRPVGHLRPRCSPAEAAVVIEQLGAAVSRVAQLRRDAGRPARAVPREANPVRVGLLRVCEPRPGAAEATVVLRTAGRTWALALRLERRDGRWAATAARVV